ncbi:putative phage abortive infection protein [Empedobacter stercoris]|uniref:putative phage abortive infection protein n=1 Tax=Empedobacter stercoris TaxID=1628248 RepID=UPI0039E9704C
MLAEIVNSQHSMKFKNTAYFSLGLAILIFIIYSVLLITNGYLFDLKGKFSIENASKIGPFVSAFVGVFLTFASTLLIIENLNLTRINNDKNQILTQKNQFESIFFNLLTQQRQIKESIKTKVEFTKHEIVLDSIENNFFDNLCLRLKIDSDNKDLKKLSELETLYGKWFTIYNAELGHYFRHLYHIVNFVHKNSYFELSKDEKYLKSYDYIKILRAQLSNSELVLLSLNALSKNGEKFKPLVEKYQLLKNINLETDMPEEYVSRVPLPEIIKINFKHLN